MQIRFKRLFALIFVLTISAFILNSFTLQSTHIAAFAPRRFEGQTVIIDAGHGGEDGGAVSVSGVSESQINLEISKRLDAIFGLYGVHTVMLRESDISLHDEGARTLREKKVSDLNNRLATIGSYPDPVLISIHQNTYTSPKYYGAQVFYADDDTSRSFAQITQEILIRQVDTTNDRKATAVPESVYLMKHISCTAILVECGFLSNPQEDALLQTDAYQIKLSAALAGSYLTFLDTQTKEENLDGSQKQDSFLLHRMWQ